MLDTENRIYLQSQTSRILVLREVLEVTLRLSMPPSQSGLSEGLADGYSEDQGQKPVFFPQHYDL